MEVGHFIRHQYADNVFQNRLPPPDPEDSAHNWKESGKNNAREVGILLIGDVGTYRVSLHHVSSHTLDRCGRGS